MVFSFLFTFKPTKGTFPFCSSVHTHTHTERESKGRRIHLFVGAFFSLFFSFWHLTAELCNRHFVGYWKIVQTICCEFNTIYIGIKWAYAWFGRKKMNKKSCTHTHKNVWKKSCLCSNCSNIWDVCCERTVVSCIDRHPKIQLFSFTVCWFPSSYLLVHSFSLVLSKLLLMLSTQPCHLQHDQSHQKHSHSTHEPHALALLLSLSVSRFHNLDGSDERERERTSVRCAFISKVCASVCVCAQVLSKRKEKNRFLITLTHTIHSYKYFSVRTVCNITWAELSKSKQQATSAATTTPRIATPTCLNVKFSFDK